MITILSMIAAPSITIITPRSAVVLRTHSRQEVSAYRWTNTAFLSRER